MSQPRQLHKNETGRASKGARTVRVYVAWWCSVTIRGETRLFSSQAKATLYTKYVRDNWGETEPLFTGVSSYQIPQPKVMGWWD